jgi:hypothetical protein
MIYNECVHISMPHSVLDLRENARQSSEQYACVALVEVRGHFVGSQQERIHLTSWQQVAQTDSDLDLLGLGELGADEEHLLWLKPNADVTVRLSLMEEENEDGYLWNTSR